MEQHELNRMFDQLTPTSEQKEKVLSLLQQTESKVSHSSMKKLKTLTVAGLAAVLLALACTAVAVAGIDQKILGYFHIVSEQEPLMSPLITGPVWCHCRIRTYACFMR